MELIEVSIFPPKSTFRNMTLFVVHTQLIAHHVNTEGGITTTACMHRGNRGMHKSKMTELISFNCANQFQYTGVKQCYLH